jgi:hypothetical protein
MGIAPRKQHILQAFSGHPPAADARQKNASQPYAAPGKNTVAHELVSLAGKARPTCGKAFRQVV